MDKEIEEAFQLLTRFDKNKNKILTLLEDRCTKPVIFTGIFGNYSGVKEIFHALDLQSQILPFISAKILKKTSYKNVHQYNGLFELKHIGQLDWELSVINLLNPKTSNHELMNLLINTTPRGQKIKVHSEVTYISHKEKIAFINANTDPLEIVRQINPDLIEEKVFSLDPPVHQTIQSIQSKLGGTLTPMETQCLAFSLCSFSSKQTAAHLHLSHRTIESYLQNAHLKVGCRCKGECLEMMYQNGLIQKFQHLCSQLMQHPESICRSSYHG